MWHNASLLNRIANGLIAAALIAVLALVAVYAARQPAFAVRALRVDGRLEHVTAEQLAAVAKQALQGTFFTLDLENARRQIRKLPWVRRVEVRRQWPDRLELELEEHVALARWGDSALVNTHGEVFEAATDATLPIFVGPTGQAGEMTRQYRRFAEQVAPIERTIMRLKLTPRAAWQIKLDDGLTLELGRSDMEARLGRFVMVYDRTIGRLPPSVAQVDLRYANGFAVRITETRGRDGKSSS